jgi:protein PhnA
MKICDVLNLLLYKIIAYLWRKAMTEPRCPNCDYEYPYPEGNLYVCPDCQHKWDPEVVTIETVSVEEILDVNGVALSNGETVTVIKDLKVKGASGSVKVGTKVKGIRLVFDSGDGHNISCKISGFGQMKLKSEFVKKS